MVDEIVSWSAIDTAARIRDRVVSVVEVVEAHLKRIEVVNPRINAITEVAEDGLDLARELDAGKTIHEAEPLRGVPVTTKINVDQAGFSNSNGIPSFGQTLCREDSAVVRNLKAAGAVVIGRTNTPEFSMRWCTSNPLYGVTRNPWDADATPGGSSGGAAAAVATGVGALAHGNDLGGSLRYPAFCCGVVTIRPSLGRVPTFNPGSPVERPPVTQTMSVQGPIARSVADVRLGLEVMSKRSASDPLWSDARSSGRIRSGKITVGHCSNPFVSPLDPALQTAMETAVAGLKAVGIEVREMAPPEAETAANTWGRLLVTESVVLMGETIRQHASIEMIRVFEAYQDHFGVEDLAGLLHAMQERVRLQRLWSQMFDEIDLFLMPTSLMRPFENDLDFKKPEFVSTIVEAQKPLYTVNLLGLPSVALPTNVVEGLPVGVQLVGPVHDDAFVLDVAERLETEIGGVLGGLPVWLF